MFTPVSSSSNVAFSAVAEARAADDANLLTRARVSKINRMAVHQVEQTAGAGRTLPTDKQQTEHSTMSTKPRRVENIADQNIDLLVAEQATPMDAEPAMPSEMDTDEVISKFTMVQQKEIQTQVAGNPCLQALASMCHGKGLPDKAMVEALLAWDCWQVNGEFSPELLSAFSYLCHGEGLPDKAKAEAVVQWLASDENNRFLMLVCRMFAGSGQSQLETLAHYEKTLRQYFKEQSTDRTDDDLPEALLIKGLALFCADPAKWRMSIAECEQFLADHRSAHGERTAERTVLKSLLRILVNHGGSGVRFWLEKYHENQPSKQALTEALSIPAPLDQTKFAVAELPVTQWRDYIEQCKNLAPAPDKEQWDALEPLRQQLNRRFMLTLTKRKMLEILWAQAPENRLRYADQMDSLFKMVPSVSQLYRIHRELGPQKMKDFLDACLAWQAAREKDNPVDRALVTKISSIFHGGLPEEAEVNAFLKLGICLKEAWQGNDEAIRDAVPDVLIQERLLEGLLLANHHLDSHREVPDFCFSKRVSCDNGKGVMIDGDTAMQGNERLSHFVAAMLIALEQTAYQFKQQRLTVPLPDKESVVVLPLPKFTLTERGFVIKNWSLEQLTVFFKASKFTEQWYQNTQDKPKRCTTELDDRLASMKARRQETAPTEQMETAPLAPSVILNLINCKRPLNSRVWKSLEQYANNSQLSVSLCKALDPIIHNDQEGIVPDVVKNMVTRRLSENRLPYCGGSKLV